MMMDVKKYMMGLLTVGVLLTGCGESLEDTYSDMAGDGKIRYLSNCTNITITPGWKRLHLEWENSQDMLVDSIKVEWVVSDMKRDTLLEATASSIDLKNLEDGSYSVDVSTIGKDKSQSLVATVYGRPYTESHEVVRSFTNGITKFYKMKDQHALMFFTDTWNDNILDIRLVYTDVQGKSMEFPLTKAEFDKEYITLENVDCGKPIQVLRQGKIEECVDVISFSPMELDDRRSFASDIKLALERRYGVSDKTDAELVKFEHFIDTVRILEFDYDLVSLENVLLCPKLEKVVLGKNRVLNLAYPSSTDVSILDDEHRSCLVLNEANRLKGVVVERYNNHYFTEENDLNPGVLVEMGAAPMPEVESAGMEVESVTWLQNEANEWDSHLEYLADDDPSTAWWPIEGAVATFGIRNYEITISYKEVKMVRGFKVVQALKLGMDQYMLPGLIKIQVSEDGVIWKNATALGEEVLGRGIGEVTLLPMAEPRAIRYVKVLVNDQIRTSNSFCGVALADVIPYN